MLCRLDLASTRQCFPSTFAWVSLGWSSGFARNTPMTGRGHYFCRATMLVGLPATSLGSTRSANWRLRSNSPDGGCKLPLANCLMSQIDTFELEMQLWFSQSCLFPQFRCLRCYSGISSAYPADRTVRIGSATPFWRRPLRRRPICTSTVRWSISRSCSQTRSIN